MLLPSAGRSACPGARPPTGGAFPPRGAAGCQSLAPAPGAAAPTLPPDRSGWQALVTAYTAGGLYSTNLSQL